MIREAVIMPTGAEIRGGVVTDTDSPEIMGRLVKTFPLCSVHRLPPLPDDAGSIKGAIAEWSERGPDLIVLIGGSGGGHRFDSRLGKDFTHTAMEAALFPWSARELYGKNGHLWCKLVCGVAGKSLVINVPGPYTEARAAFNAFLDAVCAEGEGFLPPASEEACSKLLESAAAAVAACYG